MLCGKFIDDWGITLDEEEKGILEEMILPVLIGYDWPGNIRELHNITERLVFYLQGKTDIGQWREMVKELDQPEKVNDGSSLSTRISLQDDLKTAVAKIEKEIIENMLLIYDKDQDAVAEKLGIGKTTLWRKLNNRE